MLTEAWKMIKETVLSFIEDSALSRGAAIAFYTVTSIAPVLLIVASFLDVRLLKMLLADN